MFLPLASLLLLCGCESTGGQSGFGDFLKNAGSVLNSVVNELDAAAAQGRQAGSRSAGAGVGGGRMATVATASAGPRSIGPAGSISVDGKTGAVALREPAGDAPAAAGDADAGKAVADSAAAASGGLDKSLFVGRNRLANAEKHFAERLDGFPQNVMEAVLLANPDGSPALEVDVDTGHVFANVGIRVVPERYAAFARSFRELLGAVSAGQQEKTVTFKEKQYQKDTFVAEGIAASVRGDDDEKGSFPVVVATPADPLRLSWPVAVYTLDERMFEDGRRRGLASGPGRRDRRRRKGAGGPERRQGQREWRLPAVPSDCAGRFLRQEGLLRPVCRRPCDRLGRAVGHDAAEVRDADGAHRPRKGLGGGPRGCRRLRGPARVPMNPDPPASWTSSSAT